MTGSNGVQILGADVARGDEVLSEGALAFIGELARRFSSEVDVLLRRRLERQARFDAGERPDFLEETKHVREGNWTVAPIPNDLLDRRVEITGPVDRKMIINALNSGANVFMADFEDSSSPTWSNNIEGQVNLRDAVHRVIRWIAPETGKEYVLGDQIATLMVRPRGWHLVEKNLKIDGRHVPASLFDFGLFFYHNAKQLIRSGTGPYFYLPKMQSHLEARLWNQVFDFSQDYVGIPRGTIRATVLIETLPAAFEMDEILWELRAHSAGLNCGRWDYIFSFIKTFRNDPRFVLPDRAEVGMTQPFMRAYTQLLIKTCHRRMVHAMGGMAAQIPIKNDSEANEVALAKVRADKLREVTDGHDGTWVAHPGLVSIAKQIFDEHMKTPNQIWNKREDVNVTREQLIAVPDGPRTEKGLRHNIRVSVQYLEAWLGGSGCVPLYNLMEDAATAEIGRTQVWQWIRHHAKLDDGQPLSIERFKRLLEEEMGRIREEVGEQRFDKGRFTEAKDLFLRLSTSEVFEEFLTIPAYEYLLTGRRG
jgi:malate synthase